MTPRSLLDTHSCSFIIKNRPAAVRQWLDGLRPGEVGLSAVTEAELLHGVDKSARVDHNLAAVLDFASQLVVVTFDSRVTDAYGRIRAGLEQLGPPTFPLDLQIAATAVPHSLILVTDKSRGCARVPGLKIEDWTQ